jgi:hypothetical protein
MANQGEILQEKLAPYKLSPPPSDLEPPKALAWLAT